LTGATVNCRRFCHKLRYSHKSVTFSVSFPLALFLLFPSIFFCPSTGQAGFNCSHCTALFIDF